MKLFDSFIRWHAHRALRSCTSVGDGARLVGRPWIENRGTITVGKEVSVSSIPVQSHVVAGNGGVVRIGDGVRIGHGVAICGHSEVTIGDGTLIGPFVIVLDVDFHEVNNRDSMGTARPIYIGKNVRIGSGAVILRGAFVGDDVVIAPNTVVARRVPDGMHVQGVPARPSGMPPPL